MKEKNPIGINEIIQKRKENESKEVICPREIAENILRVQTGQPLTRPLRVLNRSCDFK